MESHPHFTRAQNTTHETFIFTHAIMPTQGIHNPDVPYVPPSDMAWGPRGKQHMKSVADMEYEEKVRARASSRACECKIWQKRKKHRTSPLEE